MGKIISNINGDVVCDPFMGSGTCGLACMRAGKRFVGIERDEVFFELAVERLQAAYNQLDIFTFYPRVDTAAGTQEVLK